MEAYADDGPGRVTHLRVEGELVGGLAQVPDGWQTPDGIAVSITDRLVVVDWPNAPTHEAGNRMQDEVENRLLASVLRNVTPRRVKWDRTTEYLPDGRGLTIFSPTVTIGWGSRNTLAALSRLDADAAVIATEPDLAEALEQLRNMMDLWQSDIRAALSRLYLAAEGVVFLIRGDTGRAEWGRCALDLGLSPDSGERLYLSLQMARHVRDTKAQSELLRKGWAAMNAGECLDAVLALLEAFIASRRPAA